MTAPSVEPGGLGNLRRFTFDDPDVQPDEQFVRLRDVRVLLRRLSASPVSVDPLSVDCPDLRQRIEAVIEGIDGRSSDHDDIADDLRAALAAATDGGGPVADLIARAMPEQHAAAKCTARGCEWAACCCPDHPEENA